jgi:hypothetical protein
MLETDRRRLFLEALRPPAGMRLDFAVGTTYSLDLLALLSAPLAFTFFDQHHEDGQPLSDPLALLESLRCHAGKVRIFCQAGRIRVPRPDQKLLAFLEEMVIEARALREAGVFHPKAWMLRYAGGDDAAHFRFVCSTRNLTFDRCWDTALVLEGTPARGRQARSAPLADFLRALGGCAIRPLDSADAAALEALAAQVERVAFEPPEGFEELRFWPLGIGRSSPWPFQTQRRRRAMVVSPFLSSSIVGRFAQEQRLDLLVSTPEELDRQPEAVHADGQTYVLAPDAELAGRDGGGPEEDAEAGSAPAVAAAPSSEVLSGLHVKFYVIDDGHDARLWTGSANATDAAFHRNVELLVELRGKKSRCGIEAILGGEAAGSAGLRGLLVPYQPAERASHEERVRELISRELERAAQALAEARLRIRVEPVADAELFEWTVDTAPLAAMPLPDGLALEAWPASLPAAHAVPVAATEPLRFRVTFDGLTAFLAVGARLAREGVEVESSFVLRLDLDGAPADRAARLVRSVVADPAKVLRLLLVLLEEDGLGGAGQVIVNGDRAGGALGLVPGTSAPTLLEPLLETLDRAPHRLDDVARLLDDLRPGPAPRPSRTCSGGSGRGSCGTG